MKILAAFITAILLTLFTPSSAQAEEGCVINVLGIRVCGELLGQPLPPVATVTVRPDPIRIPGPTITLPPEQVPVPGPTETVTIPGGTDTVTVQPNTVGPSERPTVGPSELPSPTGQPTSPSGTVEPTPQSEPETNVETRTKTETIVRTVTLGLLVSLVLAALGILALFLGYIMGQKDAQRNEDDFLKSLISYARGGKHPDIKE